MKIGKERMLVTRIEKVLKFCHMQDQGLIMANGISDSQTSKSV